MSLIFCNLFRERCHTSCFQDEEPWTWKDDMANNFSSLHLVLVAQILKKSEVVLIIFIRKVMLQYQMIPSASPRYHEFPFTNMVSTHFTHMLASCSESTGHYKIPVFAIIHFSHTECTTVKINCLSNQRLET